MISKIVKKLGFEVTFHLKRHFHAAAASSITNIQKVLFTEKKVSEYFIHFHESHCLFYFFKNTHTGYLKYFVHTLRKLEIHIEYMICSIYNLPVHRVVHR